MTGDGSAGDAGVVPGFRLDHSAPEVPATDARRYPSSVLVVSEVD